MQHIFKYEATGNDFIITKHIPDNPSSFAIKTCDRHFGIGADGLLFPSPSTKGDVKMNYYNADGTIAPMCGNGIRAFSKFLYDQGLFTKDRLQIETLAGMMIVDRIDDLFEANLGQAQTHLLKPDIDGHQHKLEPKMLKVNHQEIEVYIINQGTLHTIVFTDDLNQYDHIADALCHHAYFPRRSNINFVKIENKNHIIVKTYERGVGWTLSCGTGSSASQYVAYKLGLTKASAQVDVAGGKLFIKVIDNEVYLKGPARKIAEINFFEE